MMVRLRSPRVDLVGIYTIWLRDLIRFLRDKPQILGSFARPILWLLIMGVGLGASLGAVSNFNYLRFIFPGIIAMNLLFAAFLSAISIIWDREFGFLKVVLAAPIPRLSIALGKALSGSTIALLHGGVVLLFIPLTGVTLGPHRILALLAAMFLIAFSCTASGILVASRMTSFEGFGTIGNFIIMPAFFTSGALFPIERVPRWLQIVAKVNPLTYGVDALRHITLTGGSFSLTFDLAFLAGFAAVMLVLAVGAFSKG